MRNLALDVCADSAAARECCHARTRRPIERIQPQVNAAVLPIMPAMSRDGAQSGPQPPGSYGLFEDVGRAAMQLGYELRGCIAPMLASQPSVREFAYALGIDKSLAWQIHRIATASDPVAILTALPGHAGMRKAIGAIRDAGHEIDGLERSRADLVHVLRRRGISRTQLRSMALGGSDGPRSAGGLRHLHRRAHEATVAMRGMSIGGAAIAIMLPPGGASRQMTLVAVTLLHRIGRTVNAGPCVQLAHRLALACSSARIAIANAEGPDSGPATSTPPRRVKHAWRPSAGTSGCAGR